MNSNCFQFLHLHLLHIRTNLTTQGQLGDEEESGERNAKELLSIENKVSLWYLQSIDRERKGGFMVFISQKTVTLTTASSI